MGHEVAGVNPRVRSSASHHRDRRTGTGTHTEGALEFLLDRARPRLPLPPVEGAAVERQFDENPAHAHEAMRSLRYSPANSFSFTDENVSMV